MNDDAETLLPTSSPSRGNSEDHQPGRPSSLNDNRPSPLNAHLNESKLSAFERNSARSRIHTSSQMSSSSPRTSSGFRNPRETFQNIAATAAGTLDRNMNSSSSPRESAPAVVFGATVSDRETNMASLRLRRMTAFESHDYDPIDCDIEEEQLRSRKRAEYQNEDWWKWTLSAIIGVVMGFVAFVVDGLVDKLNSFRFGMAMKLVVGDGESKDASKFYAYISSLLVTCCLAAVAGGLVSYVEPLAAGSGIPELKTYLNGVHLKGLLRLKTLLAKLGGVAFSIGAGLIAGKEGPFVHGGGLVGGGLCSFGSHCGFKTRDKPFRNDRDKQFLWLLALRCCGCVRCSDWWNVVYRGGRDIVLQLVHVMARLFGHVRWCVNLTLVGTVRLRRHGFCEGQIRDAQRFWFIHGRRSELLETILVVLLGGTNFCLGWLFGWVYWRVVRELKRTSDCVASEIYTGQ